MNKIVIEQFSNQFFTSNCDGLDIDHDGDFSDYIGHVTYPLINATHVRFLKEYDDLILQKVRGAIRNQNLVSEAYSYIQTEIIKAYKFRWKYRSGTQWLNIVKSIINRRLTDFQSKYYRNNRHLHNTGLFESDDDYLDYYNNREYDDSASKLYSHDQTDFVLKIIAENRNRFHEIELEYIDCLLLMYENEYDPMDDELVYLTMGYEPCNSKHKKEFNRVRIRVRKKVVKLISEVTDDEENWHS